jgi:hypothetical protein
MMRSIVTEVSTLHGNGTPCRRALVVLLMTVLWISGFGCQSTVESRITTSNLSLQNPTSELAAQKGFFVHATVRGVNPHTGLVDLETEVGSFYAIAAGDDLMNLKEGDEITIYVVDENAPVLRI